MSIIYYFT